MRLGGPMQRNKVKSLSLSSNKAKFIVKQGGYGSLQGLSLRFLYKVRRKGQEKFLMF